MVQASPFADVKTLIVESEAATRSAVRNILMQNGFRGIESVNTIDEMVREVKRGTLDLLICNLTMEETRAIRAVHAMRHNVFTGNPFLVTIGLMWNPNPDDVRIAVDSGVDDIIALPLSGKQLIDRITILIKSRKPFVVTSEYIGPDRRTAGKRNNAPSKIPTVEVPNTLKAKTEGKTIDLGDLQNIIDATLQDINLQKLERHSDQVVWLVNKLVPDLQIKPGAADVGEMVGRLLYTAQDMSRRLAGTRYEHIGELCLALVKVAKELKGELPSPRRRNIRLLPELAKSIQLAFMAEGAVTHVALEISQAIVD